MPTAPQAIKAAILCQYITRSLLPITIFRHYRIAKIIYIEAGYNQEITIRIHENGEFIYV